MSWYYYTNNRPYEVKGGLKVESKRGNIGTSWWTKKIQNNYLPYSSDTKVSRGKNYARSGQIISISITPGLVKAYVQGTMKTPYEIKILFGHAEKNSGYKENLVSFLAENFSEFLNTSPENFSEDFVETIEENTGFVLIPEETDFSPSCSCPDYSDFCKHAHAVLFLMAEMLDNDPKLLYTLAGFDSKSLMMEVSGIKFGQAKGGVSESPIVYSVNKENFWNPGEDLFSAGIFCCDLKRNALKSASDELYLSLGEKFSMYNSFEKTASDIMRIKNKCAGHAEMILKKIQ